KVPSPFTYDAAKACATVDAAIAAISAGDAVVVRAGAYPRTGAAAPITLKPGTLNGTSCLATTYYLAYPGELPAFLYSDNHNAVGASGTQSCITLDGWKLAQT